MKLRELAGWALLLSPVCVLLATVMVVGGRVGVLGVVLGIGLAGVSLLGTWLLYGRER